MAGDQYEGHTHRRGKGFWSEYQTNAKMPQKPDVVSSIRHFAPKKRLPASLHFLVTMTGGIGNLPGYFQAMLRYSLVRLLGAVNRS
jgi:hypothetical protein